MNTRSAAAFALVVLCACAALAGEGDLAVPGGGVVPAPAKGYSWEKLREAKGKDGTAVQVYSATKSGVDTDVALVVEQAAAESDAKKLARIKGDYNGLVNHLRQEGYTELKGERPPLEGPIGERASFSITGKNRDGQTRTFCTVLYFGKQVYHFQSSAPTQDEAKALAKVAEGVRE